MAYDLVTGDTLPTLRVSVKDEAGNAFDMSGMTAQFRWEGADGVLVERSAIISANVASYQFASSEIFASKMKIELEITNGAGKIVTGTDLITLQVREQLG